MRKKCNWVLEHYGQQSVVEALAEDETGIPPSQPADL